MKFIITEGQYDKTKQMILESFDDIGIVKTITKFKLPPKALDKLFPDGLSEIDRFAGDEKCSALEDLILPFFAIKYFKNFVFDYEGEPMYNFKFTFDNHTMALIVTITDLEHNDSLVVYATPFYEGYCELPMDVYIYDDANGISHDPEDVIQYSHNIDANEIKTFSDFSSWFKNEYPKILLEYIEPNWSKFRQEFDYD